MLQNIGIEKAWTCPHSQNGNEPNARNKSHFRIKWIECNGVNFGVVTKLKFRYSNVKFLMVWLNQLTGLHPPLVTICYNISPSIAWPTWVGILWEWVSMLTKLTGDGEYRLVLFHAIRNFLDIYHFSSLSHQTWAVCSK